MPRCSTNERGVRSQKYSKTCKHRLVKERKKVRFGRGLRGAAGHQAQRAPDSRLHRLVQRVVSQQADRWAVGETGGRGRSPLGCCMLSIPSKQAGVSNRRSGKRKESSAALTSCTLSFQSPLPASISVCQSCRNSGRHAKRRLGQLGADGASTHAGGSCCHSLLTAAGRPHAWANSSCPVLCLPCCRTTTPCSAASQMCGPPRQPPPTPCSLPTRLCPPCCRVAAPPRRFPPQARCASLRTPPSAAACLRR